jgi:hypothetical protein
MKYEKPQLTVFRSAGAAVQGSQKSTAPVQDSLTTYLTIHAYEADE